MRRCHRRMSYVYLSGHRRLSDCSLYFRIVRVFALSRFCVVPKYLSRRLAKHCDDVVLRHILRSMFEANEMHLFAACNHAVVG